jgi:hypothetical protein
LCLIPNTVSWRIYISKTPQMARIAPLESAPSAKDYLQIISDACILRHSSTKSARFVLVLQYENAYKLSTEARASFL